MTDTKNQHDNTDNNETTNPVNPADSGGSKPTEKKENMLVNLLLNIVIPTVILMKLSGEQHLGSQWAIVAALAFPIGYGLKDFFNRGKFNLFSILGIISILLTGGISLLELDPSYIAIKEAAIPGILGIVTIISLKTRFPLVKTFLYNDKILQTDKIAAALAKHNTEQPFEKCLVNASYLIALSFFLSSVLNYGLAHWLLIAPKLQPNTELYNEALGKMTALSFPVIAVPATIIMMGALFYLFRQIRQLTHLSFEEIINEA